MHPFPHRYHVTANAGAMGRVVLSHEGVEPIESSPPVEFDGPGDAWSPEGLLVAAVADCFVLTFRAIARATKLEWTRLQVAVDGTLERNEGQSSFTHFEVHATLDAAAGTDHGQAVVALERAERGCLISNSLKADVHLVPEVNIAG